MLLLGIVETDDVLVVEHVEAVVVAQLRVYVAPIALNHRIATLFRFKFLGARVA